jgi:hypothetical protein
MQIVYCMLVWITSFNPHEAGINIIPFMDKEIED